MLWAVFVLFLLASPVSASAQEGVVIEDPAPEQPWHLSADRIAAQQDIAMVEAWGDVLLSKQESSLEAEYARYYWTTQWVYLKGNVRASWGGDYLEAEEAEFDLKNQVGWLKNGRIRVQDPHLSFAGERLEKTGPDTYVFESAVVTSCDGPVPDWSLSAGAGEITVDGYAKLSNTKFLVRDKPVLFSPYLVVPVKTRRQSGFLLPDFFASSRLGLGANLPYFHVLDEEKDATFYINGMSKRGAMLGGEFRHTPNLGTKGWWRADWLYDRVVAASESDEDDQFDDDGLVRPNQHRYWIRSKFNGFFPDNRIKTKLDIDWVSDQNYLREFDDGLSGFDASRETFLEEFGRDIDDNDDLTRTSVWTVARNWTDFGMVSRVEYTQNLAFMNGNGDDEDDPTLQRLPELNFNFYKTDLLDSPFEWEARNELTYFWRRFGTTGARLDLHPQISLPLTSGLGTIIPKAGWRQTVYGIDRYQASPEEVDEDESYHTRGLFDFGVTAFSEVFRIFDLMERPAPSEATLGTSRWTKIKHSLRPEVDYSYIPSKDQSDLPEFDTLDRIEPENELSYSLTNVFTWRRDTVVPLAGGNATDYTVANDYLDFLHIRLEQAYDFTENSREDNLDQYPSRPFSDLLLEVRVKPTPWFSLWNRTWYSPYLDTITEHEHFLQCNLWDRGSAYFGLDFQKDIDDDIRRGDQNPLRVLRIGALYNLDEHWTVRSSYHRDLEEDELIKFKFGVTYAAQCWSLDTLFGSSPDENRIEFRINLYELGSLGSSMAADFE